jgi:UDP-N-acetylmuramoylalanine--D-glutamate ligase
MIDLSFLAGRRIAVLGLGRSGYNAARTLMAGKAVVMAWDDDAKRRETCAAGGMPIVDPAGLDWSKVDMLVLSPGIPHRFPKPHPVAQAARDAGVAIVSDVELLARARPDATFIGITGTNGKSTTTSLIGHILESAGCEVAVGGNLGTPALTLPSLGAAGVYVLEMSSYQLEITPSPVFDVALLLNISPDHLDRHGGMVGYIAAKRAIFHGARTAIVGIDDEHSRAIRDALAQGGGIKTIPVSGIDAAPGGVYVEAGQLIDDTAGRAERVADLNQARALPGVHNGQNAAAAYAAVHAIDLGRDSAARGILTFPGLAHRQELIATIRGVRYINDSKATNADATARALACYDTVYWIAGGVAKEGGIDSLAPLHPRIAHAFLIGAAADAFGRTLAGHVPVTQSGDLATAVRQAHAMAQQSPRKPAVVLLSPACASFDQFDNFEARGEAFRNLISTLNGDAEPHRGGAAA